MAQCQGNRTGLKAHHMEPDQNKKIEGSEDGWLTNEDRTVVSARRTESTRSMAMGADNLVAGDILAGQYEIIRKLGSGGMGTVYKCLDKPTGRLVAVKLLRREHTVNHKIMSRFQREAQAIAGLEHPGLVKLYSYVTDGPLPMLVMEYIEGRPLDVELQNRGAMSIDRATKLAVQICEALSYVHNTGIVHRDLKPSNIILKQNINGVDVVKVVDFGIAKIKDAQTTTTSTGDVFGSPSYMSPEQAIGLEAGDHADQYALGCVLFECLTGFKPFISENPLAVMMQHIRDQAPTLHNGSLGKTFPPELEAIVKRMMEKDPQNRFSSMSAVKDALLGKKFEEAVPKSTTTGAAKVPTGSLFLFGAMISGCTLLAVALVIGGWFAFQKAHPISKQEAGLNLVASTAMANLSQPASKDEFGIEEFDTPKAFIQWLRPRAPLKNLLELEYVYRNDLSPEAVEILSNAKNLQILKMPFYTKTELLSSLKSDSILELDLSDTDVNDSTIGFLKNLPNLKNLTLMGCLHLTPKGYATLKELKSLEQIHLSESVLTDEGVKEIVKIPRLTTLLLHNQGITSGCLTEIARMPNLTRLEFMNMLPNGKLAELKEAKRLQYLDLTNSNLDDRDFKTLESLKSLTEIDLSGTDLTDARLESLTAALPRLTMASFRENPKLSNPAIQKAMAIMVKRRSEHAASEAH